MVRASTTTTPGNPRRLIPCFLWPSSAPVGVSFSQPLFFVRNYLNCLRLRRRWINLGLSSAPLWPSDRPRRCARVCDRAGPEFLVSLAEAGQRGWAAKRGDTMAHVVWFPGTGRRTLVLLCQESLYRSGAPRLGLPKATRGAEKVFHWALIEEMPPWIQAAARVLHSCTSLARTLKEAILEWDKLLDTTKLATLSIKSNTDFMGGGGALETETHIWTISDWPPEVKGPSHHSDLKQWPLKTAHLIS